MADKLYLGNNSGFREFMIDGVTNTIFNNIYDI